MVAFSRTASYFNNRYGVLFHFSPLKLLPESERDAQAASVVAFGSSASYFNNRYGAHLCSGLSHEDFVQERYYSES